MKIVARIGISSAVLAMVGAVFVGPASAFADTGTPSVVVVSQSIGNISTSPSPSSSTDPGTGGTTNSTPGGGGGGYSDITWTDQKGRKVYYRADVQSKVESLHGLTSKSVRLSTQNAQDVHLDSGTAWIYRLDLSRVEGGTITARAIIRTVVDFKAYSGGGTKGVVTSYCEGYNGLCPSWVNLAFS